jgi:23S rRNA (guanosine2251-2'-O)-methyltransferase
MIYGVNPVREAVRSHPKKIRYVAVSKGHRGKLKSLLDEIETAGIPLRVLAPEQIDRLSNRAVHNGVVAEIAETAYADADELIAKASFLMILDGVQDPQNFGAILRVADCFGCEGILIPEHESCGLTPIAVKASAGASEWVPVAQVTNLARVIESLKEAGFWIYGAAAEGDPIATVDFGGKIAIVLGNEGKGIRRNVLEHCDKTISIPMRGHLDSLNVSAAAAVICYEICRSNKA